MPGLLVLLLLLLSAPGPSPGAAAASSHNAAEETLIGWLGETYEKDGSEPGRQDKRAAGKTVSSTSLSGVAQGPTQGAWVETIAWSPRAFVHHGFLSDEECEHLKQIARARLAR
jgi:hypothetical protein